jgi:hypothetical protein
MRSFLAALTAKRESGVSSPPAGHSATCWALEHLLKGVPLEELATAAFDWQEAGATK